MNDVKTAINYIERFTNYEIMNDEYSQYIVNTIKHMKELNEEMIRLLVSTLLSNRDIKFEHKEINKLMDENIKYVEMGKAIEWDLENSGYIDISNDGICNGLEDTIKRYREREEV